MWNWQLPKWPKFSYHVDEIAPKERAFLLSIGSASACLKNIEEQEFNQFKVEILSVEGDESSRIEGEILDRESLQSSIRKHFGLQTSKKKEGKKESHIAHLLCDAYQTFDQPLTHEMLWRWQSMLFDEPSAQYRTFAEPMQIVSSRYDAQRVFFEAPPSSKVVQEMKRYIKWFNATENSHPLLARAALAHVYFESIHPFEDGNGRIGRVLIEKILSQGIGRPLLIAVSNILEKRKKEYYAALGRCNKTLQVNDWVLFFAEAVLQAGQDSLARLMFLIKKSKTMKALSGKINARQEKVLIRLYAEGPSGFKGGLSAENYIAITKTSRATATRDLADLAHKGVLIKTGELRHTRYWLN